MAWFVVVLERGALRHAAALRPLVLQQAQERRVAHLGVLPFLVADLHDEFRSDPRRVRSASEVYEGE